MDCPFCNLNQEKDRILKSTKHCWVIFSNPRLMPGHLLVIPKKHIEKISQLNTEEKNDLFTLIEEYQEKVLSNISSGCDIRQHHRPFQKQTNLKVHHLHFHLQPRELFDELYQKCQKHETEIFQTLPIEEANIIINKLK